MSLLKKFDLFRNVDRQIYDYTNFGGVMTILSCIIMCILFVSETGNFMKTDIVNHMRIDSSFDNEAVKLMFDIEFPQVSCNTLTFSQESSRGSVHNFHAADELHKVDITIAGGDVKRGCRVHGFSITDRVGGNMKFGKTVDSRVIFGANPGGFIDENMISTLDLSHKINHMMFVPHNQDVAHEDLIPGTDNLLNNRQVYIYVRSIYIYNMFLYTNSFLKI